MLWIGVYEAVSVAVVGGFIGGCLMAISQRATHQYNIKFMEDHWRDDVYQLQGGVRLAHHKIEELEKKISTLSVDKPVSNGKTFSNNKGYKNQRHFNQRG
jgi:hypothetical protein